MKNEYAMSISYIFEGFGNVVCPREEVNIWKKMSVLCLFHTFLRVDWWYSLSPWRLMLCINEGIMFSNSRLDLGLEPVSD